jgi:hypothetical protein
MAAVGRAPPAARTAHCCGPARDVASLDLRPASAATACAPVDAVLHQTQVGAERWAAALGGGGVRPR